MSDILVEAPAEKYGDAIVRFYQGDNVRGTGFRVKSRYIMTCAHVVSQCLGLGKDPDKISAEQVQEKLSQNSLEINFACQGEGKDAPKLKVDVIPELWRWEGEDIAIVCLEKVEEAPPNSIEIEISTESQPYPDHQFYVYGFPDGHGETGLIARGKMVGEIPSNRRIQVQGDTAQGSSIRPGYSGAPVWDCTIGGVRGMAVASVKEEEKALETEKVKIGFIIPADKLSRAVEVVK
ncbi:MAG: serine protease, partial [Synechococcales cyanobacterium]